jgi:hypothetical protein
MNFDKKIGLHFWATFSQTHLVTLIIYLKKIMNEMCATTQVVSRLCLLRHAGIRPFSTQVFKNIAFICCCCCWKRLLRLRPSFQHLKSVETDRKRTLKAKFSDSTYVFKIRRPGVDVMITIFCDFRKFSAIFGEKMAFFLKNNVLIQLLRKLAVHILN